MKKDDDSKCLNEYAQGSECQIEDMALNAKLKTYDDGSESQTMER